MTVVLYRKYRPKKFDDVLGQDQVVSVLKSALKDGRISHAYLFSGPRGTGKTSVARILAAGIGCHEYDLVEMDAASSRGIEDVRSLREGAYTLPLKGAYKVYIIDEAHMLTREAFNAFLKTLEEPPGHVVFILATTEPQKLPETIISRCQHFAFRKISEDILRKSVFEIARKEGFKMEEEAAGLIAFFADGSFRDAQTMLDQVLNLPAAADKKITAEEARKFLSAPPQKLINDFVSALLENDSGKGLSAVQDVVEKGIDIQLFLKFVLRAVRLLLLIKLSPGKAGEFEKLFGKAELDFLEEKKSKASVKELGYILVALLDAYDETNRAYLPQLPLELALAKIYLRGQNIENK